MGANLVSISPANCLIRKSGKKAGYDAPPSPDNYSGQVLPVHSIIIECSI